MLQLVTEALEGVRVFAAFQVGVNTRPLAPVTIGFTVASAPWLALPGVNGSDVLLTPPALVFTGEDFPPVGQRSWTELAAVALLALDDDVTWGSRYDVTVRAVVSSSDPAYTGMSPRDFVVAVADNDVASVVASPMSAVVTGGVTVLNISARVTSRPQAPLLLRASWLNVTTVVHVTPPVVLFPNSSLWDAPQYFIVTTDDDAIAWERYQLSLSVSTDDTVYRTLPPQRVHVQVLDSAPNVSLATRSDFLLDEVLLSLSKPGLLAAVPVDEQPMNRSSALLCRDAQLFDAATLEALGDDDGTSAPSTCRVYWSDAFRVLHVVARVVAVGTPLHVVDGGIRSLRPSVDTARASLVVQNQLPLPLVTSAVFTGPTADVVVVTFDRPTLQRFPSSGTATALCSTVFANANLGVGCRVTWTSPTQLTVALGSGDALVVPWLGAPLPAIAESTPCDNATSSYSLSLLPAAVPAVLGGALSTWGCIPLMPPPNATASLPVPRATVSARGVTGPATVTLPVCEALTLSAVGSRSGDGRRVGLRWTVDGLNPVAVAAVTAVRAVLPVYVPPYLAPVGSPPSASAFNVTLPVGLVPRGASMRFTVDAVSVLGPVHSASVDVVADTITSVRVSLLSEPFQTSFASSPVTAAIAIDRGPCVKPTDTVVVSWLVLRSAVNSSITLPLYTVPSLSAAVLVNASTTRVTVPPFALSVGGVYTLAASVAVNGVDELTVLSPHTVVSAVPHPTSIVPVLQYQRLVGIFNDLVVNASASLDLDNVAAVPFSFSWRCAAGVGSPPSFSLPCVTVGGAVLGGGSGGDGIVSTSPVLTLPRGLLPVGAYAFNVSVSKGSPGQPVPYHFRAASTVAVVELWDGFLPRVTASIVTPAPRFNTQDKPLFVGTTTVPPEGMQRLSLSWAAHRRVVATDGTVELQPLSSSVFLTDASLPSVYGRPFSLSPGSSYAFTFTATDVSGLSASASVVVSVNTPPYGGTATVTPAVGFALVTRFNLTASGWTDDADFPLRYAFAINAATSSSNLSSPADDVLLVAAPTTTTSLEGVYLPAAVNADGTVGVIVLVFDAAGAVTRCHWRDDGATLAATVALPDLLGATRTAFVAERVHALLFDGTAAASSVSSSRRRASDGDRALQSSPATWAGSRVAVAAAASMTLRGGDSSCAASCAPGRGQCVGSTCVCMPGMSGPGCVDGPARVNARLSEWSSWSPCSHSCGGGVITRTRSCLPPERGGTWTDECPDPSRNAGGASAEERQTQPCAAVVCVGVADGGYSDWSPWSSCSACAARDSGTVVSVSTSQRWCTNPAPSLSPPGQPCAGGLVETQERVCRDVPCVQPVRACPGSSDRSRNATGYPRVSGSALVMSSCVVPCIGVTHCLLVCLGAFLPSLFPCCRHLAQRCVCSPLTCCCWYAAAGGVLRPRLVPPLTGGLSRRRHQLRRGVRVRRRLRRLLVQRQQGGCRGGVVGDVVAAGGAGN